MILKLVLPTICLILLVHPVISDIDNQWAKKVSNITKKLFEAAEVYVDTFQVRSQGIFRDRGDSPNSIAKGKI